MGKEKAYISKEFEIIPETQPINLFYYGFRDGGNWIAKDVVYFRSDVVRVGDDDDPTHFYMEVEIGIPQNIEDFSVGKHVRAATIWEEDGDLVFRPVPGKQYTVDDDGSAESAFNVIAAVYCNQFLSSMPFMKEKVTEETE